MSFDPISAALDLGSKIIDKIFPNAEEREKAKFELFKMKQEGELKELEVRMSAILAEANSSDPWTSRARPSFLYVIYILILVSIPLGIASIWWPSATFKIAEGMKSWLSSVPSDIWDMFKIGYVGYSAARSIDKWKK